MKTKIIARWESLHGKHWVEFYAYADGTFGYHGDGCGGVIVDKTVEEAKAYFEKSVLYYRKMDHPSFREVKLDQEVNHARELDRADAE